MRLFFLSAILFFAGYGNIKAQDLIVTGKGDSLNCKITKIKKDFIYFTFKYENEIRNTLLRTSEIKKYQIDFFKTVEVPANKVKKYNGDDPRFRIGIFGGWSYITAKVSDNVPSEFHDYIKELKSGYHLGGDATYFFSSFIGIGVKYSMFRTKNHMDNVYATNTVTGAVRTGKLKDDITTQYVGPAVCLRFISANKSTQFFTDLSVGYVAYKNKATLIDDFTLTSSTVGLNWDLGVDFSLDKSISIGATFAFVNGSLSKYKYDDGTQTKTIKLDKDNHESISRIDLSVALKLNIY